MKRINDFAEALEYVHRLGFTPGGNIAFKQMCLCALVDALKQAAGGYPYLVVCHRYPGYPWLSEFEVRGSHGVKVVRARDITV